MLAMKRRKITQTQLSERTGLSMPTLRNILLSEPSVSMGHYLMVLSSLCLASDLAEVVLDDEFGRKLQAIELLKTSNKASIKAKNASSLVYRSST